MTTLYSKTGDIIGEIRKFTYNGSFMGECFINTTVESEKPIDFNIGDYCVFRGERFELNYLPAKNKTARSGSHGSAFIYDNIKFNSLADETTTVEFLDVVIRDNEIHGTSLSEFSFYANSVKDLTDRIQANLDRVFKGDKAWTIVMLPELESPSKSITVSKISIWEAIQLIQTEFKVNFTIRNRTITVGTSGYSVGAVFGYGQGNGLYDIQQTANQDAKIITRLRAYGSTRNIPHRYYNNLKDDNNNPYILESLYIPNLMLPSFPYVINQPKDVFIDSDNVSTYGVREGSVYFDGSDGEDAEIYPSIEGMTALQLSDSGVIVSLPTGDNGNIDEILGAENPDDDGIVPLEGQGELAGTFKIYLKDLGFDLSEKDQDGQYKYATSDTMQISMKSGMGVARTFDVVENGIKKDTSLGYTRFIVECNRFIDDSIQGGMAFPNNQYSLQAGDKFVLLGIDMPDVYVKSAAQRLLVAAQEYLSQNDSTKYTYTPKIDEKFMAENPDLGFSIKEGDISHFDDTDLEIEASVIIQNLKISYDLDKSSIPSYEVSLSNERINTTIQKIQNSINSLQANMTGVTIDQVRGLIQQYGAKYFLSKRSDDTAVGHINLMKDLSVLGDSYVKGDVVVDGVIDSNQFGSKTFTSGMLGSGHRFWIDKNNGQSYGEIDHLYVRRNMDVRKLTIAEINSIGGEFIISSANMYISNVEELSDSFKCYFDTDGNTISNRFVFDDQVICQTFEGGNTKYYWSRVVEVGSDYIRISKTDKSGVGLPAVGDELIQLGNRTDVNRQSAIVLSSYGSDAPSIKQYSGINSYNLTGKEKTVTSPKGNKFTGTFIIEASGKDIVSFVDESINNVKIGGVNLISNLPDNWEVGTVNENKSAGLTYSEIKDPSSTSIRTKDLIAVGSDFILTINPVYEVFFTYYDADKKYLGKTNGTAGSMFVQSGYYEGRIIHYLAIVVKTISSVSDIDKIKIQITRGNKATDWTASPEDTKASIDSKVAYTEYNSKMQVLENEISLKASQSNLNALGEQVSELDAELVVQAGQITSAVTKAEHAQNTANSKNTIYQSDTEPNEPSGGFTIGDIWRRESLTDVNGNIDSDATKNIFRLENRWDGTAWIPIGISVSGSYITQTAESIDLVVDDAVNEVKNGITVNTDGITAFGEQFKVDTDLIANAIQTDRLEVGQNAVIESDGTIKAKNAELEGSLTIVWDGDTSKPIQRVSIVDKSSGTEKTKVIISPTNIRSINEIAANQYNKLVVESGEYTDVSAIDDYRIWDGNSFVLQNGFYYDIHIPEIGITTSREFPDFGISSCELYLVNATTGGLIRLGSWDSSIGDVIIRRSFNLTSIPPSTYFLRAYLTASNGGVARITISQDSKYIIKPIQDAIEIGKNGILGVFTTSRWFHLSTEGQYTRMGNYGFRITESSGIQYSSNMNASTPTWKTLT